ncbi:Mannosylglycerate hydrolase [subsurface metagenome]
MKKKTIIHLISHNHWDPAWFAQRKYTRKWLIPFVNNVLKTLREQSEYKFVLDGQTSIIEDYFDQLKNEEREKKREEIEKYVKEERLLVGPFYVGSDWTLTSGTPFLTF